jgi:outer membrane lipoprotein SlyB
MKKILVVLATLFLFCGCVREVRDVRMSKSIFLKTPRGAKVHVDVRNTGQAFNFPIEPKIMSILQSKGYEVVQKPNDAEIIFRANIRYSGLAKDINTGAGAVSGAYAGAVGGMAVAHNTSSQNYAAGAAAGVVVGALVGYAIEEAIAKSTFISIIDVLIEEKGNPFPHTTSYVATLREQGLEMQQAVNMMVDQIAVQVANIF